MTKVILICLVFLCHACGQKSEPTQGSVTPESEAAATAASGEPGDVAPQAESPPTTASDAATAVETGDEEGEDDDGDGDVPGGDVLQRAVKALQGQRPFSYFRRRTALVAAAVDFQAVSPTLYGDWEMEVLGLTLPGGPSLVCAHLKDNAETRCWSIEGVMDFLHVPEQFNTTMLEMVAVMAGRERVDFQLAESLDGTVTAEPERKVVSFEPDGAPKWAVPWLPWLEGDLDDVHVVSGDRPVEHVFMSEGERGVLCIRDGTNWRCTQPSPTAKDWAEVSYSPGNLDFGPGIVAITRTGRLETDDVYHSVQSVLLFDMRPAQPSWIATLPGRAYMRKRVSAPDADEDKFLDVVLGWELKSPTKGKRLDPGCFVVRRASGARALLYRPDGESPDGMKSRRTKMPKLTRVSKIPLDATVAQMSVGAKFAGRWSVGAEGSLVRRARCVPKR